MQLSEILGLMTTMLSMVAGVAVIINRFGKLEGRVDRLEYKVDEILIFLSQQFKNRKGKKLKHLYRKK